MVMLLFLGIVWGLSFSLARMSTEEGFHPLTINYWSCLLAAIFLCLFCLFTKQRVPLQRPFPFLYVSCGILGIVVPGTLYFYAASQISAGILSITVATVPLLTFIAGTALQIERFSYLRLIGVILGIVSIGMLVLPAESLPNTKDAYWVLLMIVASACYAAETLIIDSQTPPNINPFVVVTGMLMAATLIMTPLIWLTGTFETLTWPPTRSTTAIIGMAIITVTATGLFYHLIVTTGPVFAAQTAYLVTLGGVVWGIIIYDEKHSAWIWAALLIMILALFLVQPRDSSDHSSPVR
jgi:drug/metabolite transporter (DMT)-like permease